MNELPIVAFASVPEFEQWMAGHHTEVSGVWIKMAKKATGIASVNHDQALDVALCYGWIDGQRRGFDDTYFLQKFTPRRAKSLWSKRNVEKIAMLTTAKRMQLSGFAEVEAAKSDGRWAAAYDSAKNMEFPKDFLQALENNKVAKAYFDTLSGSNVYAIAFRLATAKKPETRQRRFETMLKMLEKGDFK